MPPTSTPPSPSYVVVWLGCRSPRPRRCCRGRARRRASRSPCRRSSSRGSARRSRPGSRSRRRQVRQRVLVGLLALGPLDVHGPAGRVVARVAGWRRRRSRRCRGCRRCAGWTSSGPTSVMPAWSSSRTPSTSARSLAVDLVAVDVEHLGDRVVGSAPAGAARTSAGPAAGRPAAPTTSASPAWRTARRRSTPGCVNCSTSTSLEVVRRAGGVDVLLDVRRLLVRLGRARPGTAARWPARSGRAGSRRAPAARAPPTAAARCGARR